MNRRTVIGVQLVALRVHFRERDRWDQDRIIKRSERICFYVGFREVARFIQTEREQSVITFLVRSKGLLFAEEHAQELQLRHVPAHHGNAYGQRGGEDKTERSPKPRPENRRDDQRDGRDAGARSVEPRLARVEAYTIAHR